MEDHPLNVSVFSMNREITACLNTLKDSERKSLRRTRIIVCWAASQDRSELGSSESGSKTVVLHVGAVRDGLGGKDHHFRSAAPYTQNGTALSVGNPRCVTDITVKAGGGWQMNLRKLFGLSDYSIVLAGFIFELGGSRIIILPRHSESCRLSVANSPRQ